MRVTSIVVGCGLLALACAGAWGAEAPARRMSRAVLEDKVRGGWAGQMIGVAFGAPTEFRSNGKILEGELKWTNTLAVGAILTNTATIATDGPANDIEPNYANNLAVSVLQAPVTRVYLPLIRR